MKAGSWFKRLTKKERALVMQLIGALDLNVDYESMEEFLLTLIKRVNTIRGIVYDAKNLLDKIK